MPSNCFGIKLYQLPLATAFQAKQQFLLFLMNINGKLN